MKRNNSNKELLSILIDIRYCDSMNKFEEFYGDSVHYSDLEQESYIELKDLTHNHFKRKIKFKKFQRSGMVLTLRAEMTNNEYKKFTELNNKKFFDLTSNFVISKINILNTEEENGR